MGEDTNQIEQEIRERRAGLGRNLDELEDKARDLADWRTHYRSHTGAFLGAAIGAGLLLGLAAIPARRSSRGDEDLLDGRDPNYVDDLRRSSRSQEYGSLARAARQFGHTWDQIADGLVMTASAKALQVVADLVPGFADQFEGQATPHGTRTH